MTGITQDRFVALRPVAISVLALTPAALGIYGATADVVARRRAEIGIRVAIGAASVEIIRIVPARVWIFVSTGVAIGIAISRWRRASSVHSCPDWNHTTLSH